MIDLIPEIEQEIITKYALGASCNALSKIYDISGPTIKKILCKNGLKIRNTSESKLMNTNFNNSKQTIEEMHKNGDSISKIFKTVGHSK